MPLNKDEAEKIASLFNTITVSEYLLEKHEYGSLRWFLNAEARANATIHLFDKFGIELPSLDTHRSNARWYGEKADQIMEQEGWNKREDNLVNADL